jgi:DNA-binding response OmpR family regulator
MDKTRVLLAEDDKNLGNILKNYLEAKGYETKLSVNGEEALLSFKKEKFDFCILDVMMPLKDGYTLAREIRSIDKRIPILFLTAKSMPEDVLEGFKVGGDDYLSKPFSMEELLARMKAILRRITATSPEMPKDSTYKIGQYVFEYKRQSLIFNGLEQKLTSKESELLRLLCDHANRVLDRREALIRIWNDDSYFNARSMDVYIVKLRKYLKEDPAVELINVHGVGFKLVLNT